MKFLLLLILPFIAFGYTPSNDRTLEADNITSLSTDYVTIKKPLELDLETIFTILSTPATPAAGYVKLYPKSDDKFYRLNSSGVESLVGLEFTSVNDNRLVKSDGTSGTSIQESGITIDDSNNVSNINDLSLNGTTTLNVLLNGPVKATLGVISSGDIDLTSEVTGILPIANGGTGSATQNYVDLTTAQTIAGLKTFSDDLTLSSTGAIQLPVGTELQRPTGVAGKLRFNSDSSEAEIYDGTAWAAVGGGVDLLAKGSLLGSDGAINTEFLACADDEIIVWDAAETLGFKCDVIPDMSLPLMAKGSLVTSNGTANGEFTACADGEVLVWDAAEASGIKCLNVAFTDAVSTPLSTGKAKVCSWQGNSNGTIIREYGDCILSTTQNGTGDFSHNFNASYWGEIPNCTCVAEVSTGLRECMNISTTTGFSRVATGSTTSGAYSNFKHKIICHGVAP